MEQTMMIREAILRFVRRFDRALIICAKFAVGLYVFSVIHGVSFYDPRAARLFEGGLAAPVTLFAALLFAIAPTSAAYGLIAADLALQTSKAPELAALIGLLCALVILFYVRLAPKAAWLLLATVIAFHFKLQYAVVLIAGLYVGAAAVVPVAVGCWAAAVMPSFLSMIRSATPAGEFSIMELPNTAVTAMNGGIAALTGNVEWIVYAFVFSVVILGMYAVAHAPINYQKEMALGFGVAALLVCLIVAAVVMEGFASPVGAIGWTLLAGVIAAAVRLFDSLPDYAKAERVQFEDEDNIYYVRVIPKL